MRLRHLLVQAMIEKPNGRNRFLVRSELVREILFHRLARLLKPLEFSDFTVAGSKTVGPHS